MNEILRKTHQNNNINVLKARDAFFNKARDRYKLYLTSVFLPIFIATLTYVPIIYSKYNAIEIYRDYIIGITSVICLIIGKLISDKNDNDILISNILREYYDCKVFDLKPNPLIYDFNTIIDKNGNWKKNIIEAWESQKDISKGLYEVWYGETFSSDRRINILTFQLDNVIYTYHIYKEYLKNIKSKIRILFVIVFSILFLSIFIWKKINIFILMMFSIAGAIQMLSEMKSKTEDLVMRNNNIYEYAKNNVNIIKKQLKNSDNLLRSLQDVIAENRNEALFVPKSVRDRYLKKDLDNPYAQQSSEIMNIYYKGLTVTTIEKPSDIEVFSMQKSAPVTTLDKIHKRLMTMLLDVDKVLKENKIDYMLDGGTLIGAIRVDGKRIVNKKNGKFIFWDDDIDLSISYKDIDKFIHAIKSKLSHKYDVQYYTNDKFYSPRLSNIRIREKNSKSVLFEKDSELFEKYKYRGLFIDVYAYSPILCNLLVDKLWRKLFIHPINKKIRRIESMWKYGKKSEKSTCEKQFLKLKSKYLNRVSWYLKNSKCEKYYACVPNYLNDINCAGPYVKKDDLYGKKEFATFEGNKFMIPTDADAILTAFYGDNWYISPYESKQKLIKKYGKDKWISAKEMYVTPLKHYKYIEKF